jgi:hypothetical protein
MMVIAEADQPPVFAKGEEKRLSFFFQKKNFIVDTGTAVDKIVHRWIGNLMPLCHKGQCSRASM